MRSIRNGQTCLPHPRNVGSHAARFTAAMLTGLFFALGLGASEARPAPSGQATIGFITFANFQTALQVLIPRFEHAHPAIKVEATYEASATELDQVEPTELAAGNGPDLISVFPGCELPVSMCVLGKEGDLMPLVRAPWTKRSLPLIVSGSKVGPVLYAFEPAVSLLGMFTNDALFRRLGLAVPQSFPQLLAVCEKARADGTAAVLFPGGFATGLEWLVTDLAVASVYAKDNHWTEELRSGSVSFDGSAGWQEALHELVEMNDDGCFEPGVTGYSTPMTTQFAQGQGLMTLLPSSFEGVIAAARPAFKFSFVPFPNGSSPGRTATYLVIGPAIGVNAHSSPANQAAASAFVDFLAQPAQDRLLAEDTGSLTQEQFMERQLPSFMSSFAPLVQSGAAVVSPAIGWWNPNVALALDQQGEGLLTGQATASDVLSAMDAAWKLGRR